MIVTNENTKLMSKDTNNPRIDNNGQGSSSDPPPSYQPTQIPPSHNTAIQYSITYRQSPARRFWSALLVAFLVWFLCTALVRSIYSAAHWTHDSWGGSYLIPANIALVECRSGDQWSNSLNTSQNIADSAFPGQHLPYASSTSFELPLRSKTLLFLSRGYQTYGTVNIVTSDQSGDVAKVHVNLNHASRHFPNEGAKICLIKRANGEIGVGLFTRRWSGFGVRLYYEATIVLPKGSDGKAPLHVEGLETDVENALQRLGDLRDSVTFSYISLKSSNSLISVKSVNADTASFQTSNGPITGVFNVSRSLSLRTSNSPIDVDVGMRNRKDYVSDLSLRSSNGKISARSSLIHDSAGGRYMVTAMTSNGALDLSFPTSPVDSALKLTATTSNSPATVSLDAAYEGTLSLTTSNYSPSVRQRIVKDPSGKHRRRVVNIDNTSRNTLRGSVSWSGHEGYGTAEVRSSNSPVIVQL